ncbi:MAG: GWxTD domain-containing protein [Calditrichaceae bacterium]
MKSLSIVVLIMLITIGCSSIPKTLKEKTLDDMYLILSEKQYKKLDSLNNEDDINKFLDDFWKNLELEFGNNGIELRKEYLRRLSYANKHYPDRMGWGRSDRKRIYLIYGPPAYIDRSLFTNIPIGDLSIINELEIWEYMKPGKYDSEMKFIFADFDGVGIYKIIYSSEDYGDTDMRVLNSFIFDNNDMER